jgi:ATP-dependent helicase/nuclease subunit B
VTSPKTGSAAVDSVDVPDARALQAEIARIIQQRKAGDPLSAVTLVVDSPLTGTMLRRQLVAEGHLGGGTGNIRLLTAADLIGEVADCAGVAAPADVPRVVREAVVSAVLATDPGPFAVSATHPSTAQRLSDTLDELEWCALDPDDVTRASAAAPTTVSKDVLDFIRRVRSTLGALPGGQAKAALVEEVVDALPHDGSLLPLAKLGSLVVVTQHVPAPLDRLLGAVAEHIPVYRIREVPSANQALHSVRDCPDPSTEVAFAVRQAAGAMVAGARSEQVAIVYGTSNPYAPLLAAELDRADIAWHGPTVTTLGATALARVAAVVLTMAAERAGDGSGITRPLLLRWIGAAPLQDGDERLESWRWRRLIRDNDLFGDAEKWAESLQALANPEELADPDDDDAERDLIRQRRLQRQAESAASLAVFLRRVGETLDRLLGAPTWRDLGEQLWTTLVDYHLQTRWWSIDPAERQTHQRLRELLLHELPALDELTRSLGGAVPEPTPTALRQVIDRDLHHRRGRHGDIGAGLHVGPLRTALTLTFEHVIVLGAVEGVLPPTGTEDPLLPDAVRKALREAPADLPTTAGRVRSVESEYRSIVSNARTADVTRPRGALPGHATTHPSRYLPKSGAEPSIRVSSCWDSLSRQPWPAVDGDVSLRDLLADPDEVPEPLEAPVAAARAAWRAEFDRFHGDLSDAGSGKPVWDITSRPLSASAVESFLHCPYHFFVQRVLGFSTDEIVDEIDEVTPRDLGTLLHRALDVLVGRARDEGWLPGPGEPWPDDAETKLRSLFDAEVDAATAQGRTGWAPSWQHRYEQVVATFGGLLDKDTSQVRSDPPTAPHASELGFGGDDDFPVTVTLDDGTIVGLRGAIDRVDLSADGAAVGIVDYKTGKSSTFRKQLGMPGRRSDPEEREKIQDLVYDAAARTAYPSADQVDVWFVFVPDDGEVTVLNADHEPDRPRRLVEILTDLHKAGVQGRFPPKPRGGRDYCPVCERMGRRAAAVADGACIDETTDAGEVRP